MSWNLEGPSPVEFDDRTECAPAARGLALRCRCEVRTNVAIVTGPVPDSLLSPGLRPVWENARRQLDRFGSHRRGTVAQPTLDAHSAHVLESLLGRKPTSRVDLAALERAFVVRGIGADLCGA